MRRSRSAFSQSRFSKNRSFHPDRWKEQWNEVGVVSSGNSLYHGTSYGFPGGDIRMPAWFSQSKQVAQWFALRRKEKGRVLRYRVESDLKLPQFQGKDRAAEFGETFQVNMRSSEGMRETIGEAPVPGWIIPYNYARLGGGDDILLCSKSDLRFIGQDEVQENSS